MIKVEAHGCHLAVDCSEVNFVVEARGFLVRVLVQMVCLVLGECFVHYQAVDAIALVHFFPEVVSVRGYAVFLHCSDCL